MDTNSNTQKKEISDKAAAKQEFKYLSELIGKLKKVFSIHRDLKVAVIAAVVASIVGPCANHLIEGYSDYRKSPEIIATPQDINYNQKDTLSYVNEDKIMYKKGVKYWAKAYLKALNKSYHISYVSVSITLKSGEIREGIFRRGSPPAPNSDVLDIQYLRSLEKDKDYLCNISFFVEGEHKNSIAEMAFDKIELRLYDNDDGCEKVNLYHSDFPEL